MCQGCIERQAEKMRANGKTPCHRCKGTKYVATHRRRYNPFKKCPACKGTGEQAAPPKRTSDTMSEAIALSSPSGRMSKAARRDAHERFRVALFGKDGLAYPTCPQPSKREKLLRDAKMFRDLADRGMSPRRYRRQAEQLEKQAAALVEAGKEKS